MNFLCYPTLIGLFALLSSCGGGGGGSATVPVIGYVVDAPVEGLSYTCGGLSGTTGSDGSFSHDAGSACTFKIGNVTIGNFNAAPVDGIVTPHDLAGVSRNDPLNSSAVAIAQFLQSLDDGTGSGKIKIPASVVTALSAVPAQKIVDATPLSQNQLSTLVSTATGNTKTLVAASTAAANMNTYIQTTYPNLDTSKGAVAPTNPSSESKGNAPSFTSSLPTTLTATGSSTGFTATTDINATGYFVLLPATSKAPNKWQVIAGTDASNAAVTISGTLSMTGGSAASKTITGLAFDTAYKLYFVAVNASQASKVSEVATSSVTTAPEPKAPVLTGSIPSTLTQTQHATSFSLTSDVTAIGYWVVLPSTATAPTAAQIVEGKDVSGNSIALAGNAAMSGGTVKSFTLSGMSYGQTYKAYFVATNAADNTKITNILNATIALEYNPIRLIAFGDGFNAVNSSGFGVNTIQAIVGTDLPDDTVAGRLAYNRFGITLTNVSGSGVLDATKKGFSYAQGSARIQDANTPNGDSLDKQISNFLTSNSPNATDLFVISIGSLDIYDAYINNTTLAQPVATLVSAIKRLTDAGAKYVLVVYPPNIARTPWAIRKNSTERSAIQALSYDSGSSCLSFSCRTTLALNTEFPATSAHQPILVADLMGYSNLLTGTAGTSTVTFQGSAITTTGSGTLNTFPSYGVTNPDLPACYSVSTPPTSPLICDSSIANSSGGVNSGTTGWNNTAWDYKTSVFADNFYFTPFANRLFADYIYNVTFYRAGWR